MQIFILFIIVSLYTFHERFALFCDKIKPLDFVKYVLSTKIPFSNFSWRSNTFLSSHSFFICTECTLFSLTKCRLSNFGVNLKEMKYNC